MVNNERPLSREPISACPCDPYDEPCVASFGVSVPKLVTCGGYDETA